ncbi:SpoIIE family protein phosphatase [Kineococcus rubinsiae]|uniref:SpoIIE family protein phosphatase n=1 Tax=Kineococcus rubinsiae TaxID=2609562 RepID=UPI0014311E80|nr:SpoIIE family protein phosphatase [Kineococcus rubinsiae]NIZ89417.1 SpoIIE family protein phosphatase [Kineococcus rubinsiae]
MPGPTPLDTAGSAPQEAARLAALRDYVDVEATPPPELQAVVRLAARATGLSTAVVNIIDESLQRQLATEGCERADCAREDSMCSTSIWVGGVVHVPDARRDVRFAANPWVDGRLGGIRTYAAAPLLTPGGQVLGTLCVFDSDLRTVTAAQRDELADLATLVVALFDRERRGRREAAAAVEAEAARRAAESARALQDALLPHRLPNSEAVTLTTRYLPAAVGSDVGGDFFDAVRTDRAFVVVIGDVQGHNAAAAALMGQVRTAVSAYVREGHGPAAALERTNALLVGLGAELFATCCLLSLDERTGEVTVASAGHPPPLVFGGRGSRTLDVDPGPPLGVQADATYPSSTHRLRSRSRLLLYTDGVVEWEREEGGQSTTALEAVLQEHATASAERVADHVLAPASRAMVDDAALVVLDYLGPDPTTREVRLLLPADARAVAAARDHLRTTLADWDLLEPADAAELVVSELVTNALLHTGSSAALTLRHDVEHAMLHVGVEDTSTRHPQPRESGDEATGGRGMHIVEVVCERWWVAPRGDGKTVWAELTA